MVELGIVRSKGAGLEVIRHAYWNGQIQRRPRRPDGRTGWLLFPVGLTDGVLRAYLRIRWDIERRGMAEIGRVRAINLVGRGSTATAAIAKLVEVGLLRVVGEGGRWIVVPGSHRDRPDRRRATAASSTGTAAANPSC